MLHPFARRSIPWALSAALAFNVTPAHLVLADGSEPQQAAEAAAAFRAASIGKVSIGGSSYIEISDVQQLGTTVRFTLSLYNGGSSELQFVDYWVRLRSASGSTFSPKLYDADQDKNRIAPKTTETFSFYVTVNESTKLHDLAFDIIRWDFNNPPTYQSKLGTLKAPPTYSTVTPAGSHLVTNIQGVPAIAQIKNVNISRTSDKYIANLIFEYENIGTKSFTIPNYEYAIVTSEGLMYPLTVSNLPEGTQLHPRFKRSVTLRGELPGSLENKNWKLVLSNTQGTVSNVPAMSFQLPASSAEEAPDAIPAGESKELLVADQKIEAKVVRTVRNQTDRNYVAAIRFSFANQGTKSVKLPNYKFEIVTSSGLTYPVTADLSNLSIDPLVEREIELRATLPLSAGGEGWMLVLHDEGDDADPNAVGSELAKFSLSDDPSGGLGQGSTYEYSNEMGTYRIHFADVQRVPWEDEDILSASITIGNPGNESLPIPDIVGYFMLDNKIKVDAAILHEDSLLAIKPNETVNLKLYGKIPYTYEFSDLRIYLQEKLGQSESELVNIVDFSYIGKDAAKLPVVELGKKHKVNGAGREAEIQIRHTRTYDGLTGKLITTIVNITNLEKRSTNVATLTGYFETEDGMVYPAELTPVDKKVQPLDTVSIVASAQVPKSVSLDHLKLVLGEAVSEGKFADGQANIDGYVNAVQFAVPAEPKEAKTDFQNLLFYPNTISIHRVSGYVGSNESILITFDYEMSKSPYVHTGDEHVMVFEAADPMTNISSSKEFTFSGEGDSALKQGSNKMTFEITDRHLTLKLPYMQKFKVRIYDQYNGQKKLLAEQEFEWFR